MSATCKYDEKTIKEIICGIMDEYKLNVSITLSEQATKRIEKALNEAFTVGWGHGEDFAKECCADR